MSDQFKALVLDQKGEEFTREVKTLDQSFLKHGDVTIKARNINLVAEGGGQDGVINLKGTRLINVEAPDIRLQGEKILISACNSANIISKGFFQLKYGFVLAAADADMTYGVMSEVLKKATTFSKPKVGVKNTGS